MKFLPHFKIVEDWQNKIDNTSIFCVLLMLSQSFPHFKAIWHQFFANGKPTKFRKSVNASRAHKLNSFVALCEALKNGKIISNFNFCSLAIALNSLFQLLCKIVRFFEGPRNILFSRDTLPISHSLCFQVTTEYCEISSKNQVVVVVEVSEWVREREK